MLKFTKRFYLQEDGAVTVDWVVLVSIVVAMGWLAVTPVQEGTELVSDETKVFLEKRATDLSKK